MKAYGKLIILDNGKSFFGPGVADLLKEILKTNSIKDASKNMGLSYSKALRILKEAEQHLGFTIVEKFRGGDSGGESRVTDKGKKLIESYDFLYEEVNKTLDKNFDKYFAWIGGCSDDKVE